MDEAKTGGEQEASMDKLVQDFKLVLHDAEGLIKATAGDMGERAREARARLAASLETAKAQYAKLQDLAVQKAQSTDQIIRAHPYETVGIAFGVGLLIGVLVSRK